MTYSRREQAYKYRVIPYNGTYWAALHVHHWRWLWDKIDWWHREPFGYLCRLYLVITKDTELFVGYAYLKGDDLLYIETHPSSDGAGTALIQFLQENYKQIWVRSAESTNPLIKFYSNLGFSVAGGPRTGVYDWYWKRRIERKR